MRGSRGGGGVGVGGGPLLIKVIRNIASCVYASAKFEFATTNGLGEDRITRNVTDRLRFFLFF